MRRIALLLALVGAATAAASQQVDSGDSTFVDGILVTSSDVTTCPYHFVQPVSVSVTTDWGGNGRSVIFEKLRNQARKIGADAVVLVSKGGKHMTAWAWTRREYNGGAIRYVDRRCAPSR
ncbi:MAG: hypothetical protein JWO81_136 [Alphaproteobacteria bacterium]|nr:hypothetical protein [Alphaproteobacteria bacterium]